MRSTSTATASVPAAAMQVEVCREGDGRQAGSQRGAGHRLISHVLQWRLQQVMQRVPHFCVLVCMQTSPACVVRAPLQSPSVFSVEALLAASHQHTINESDLASTLDNHIS